MKMDLLYFGAEPEDLKEFDEVMAALKAEFPNARVYDGTDPIMGVIETVLAIEYDDADEPRYREWLVRTKTSPASLGHALGRLKP